MAKQTRNPDRFAHLQGKVRFGRCDICGLEYPETSIQRQEGYAVCIDDYEPMGRDSGRDRERQKGTALAAQISAGHKNPQYTGTDFITGAGLGVTLPFVRLAMASDGDEYASDQPPIELYSGGSSTAVGLGGYLSASNVLSISSSHAGITASGISYPSTDEIDFTLSAASDVPVGDYDLIIDYATTLGIRNLFRKRIRVLTTPTVTSFGTVGFDPAVIENVIVGIGFNTYPLAVRGVALSAATLTGLTTSLGNPSVLYGAFTSYPSPDEARFTLVANVGFGGTYDGAYDITFDFSGNIPSVTFPFRIEV
jgi:hypothetical protein